MIEQEEMDSTDEPRCFDCDCQYDEGRGGTIRSEDCPDSECECHTVALEGWV